MGAGASSLPTAASIEEQTLDILKIFTLYRPDATVTQEDYDIAFQSWEFITNDKSPEYLRKKQANPPLEAASCLSWFYDCFYEFSSEMDPEPQQLYKDNLRVQVRALVAMIQSSLSMFKGLDLSKVDAGMKKLAVGHNKRGVRSYQYSLVGAILIKTFMYCLGHEWEEKVSKAWANMFSVMLKVLIPAALKVEAEENLKSSNTDASRDSISISIQSKTSQMNAEMQLFKEKLNADRNSSVHDSTVLDESRATSQCEGELPPDSVAATVDSTPELSPITLPVVEARPRLASVAEEDPTLLASSRF